MPLHRLDAGLRGKGEGVAPWRLHGWRSSAKTRSHPLSGATSPASSASNQPIITLLLPSERVASDQPENNGQRNTSHRTSYFDRTASFFASPPLPMLSRRIKRKDGTWGIPPGFLWRAARRHGLSCAWRNFKAKRSSERFLFRSFS